MKVLALITTAKCADLTSLCVDSLRKYAPEVDCLVLVNEMDRPLRRWLGDTGTPFYVHEYATGTGSDHARAIEAVRATNIVRDRTPDVVVLVDNDCVILSRAWYAELARAFADAWVGGWGAEWITRPEILHASMCAMRASAFYNVTTFRPVASYDTAGLASSQLASMGYRVITKPGLLARRGWRVYYTSGEVTRVAWSHLGSGTFAVRPWLGARVVRSIKAAAGGRLAQKAIEREHRRAHFLAYWRACVQAPSLMSMIHGRGHDAKMVEDHR